MEMKGSSQATLNAIATRLQECADKLKRSHPEARFRLLKEFRLLLDEADKLITQNLRKSG
jgi:hypothetical protein